MREVIVTRHPALVEYLVEEGIVSSDVKVIEHATPDDVRGKHVYGILPLDLASLAFQVTAVGLNIPIEKRGKELSLEEVRAFALPPKTYQVVEITGGKDSLSTLFYKNKDILINR